MLTTDIYKYIRLFYECKVCHLYFPIWIVPDKEWRSSGFRRGNICKQCFERVVPSPKYITLDEYIAEQIKIRVEIAQCLGRPIEPEHFKADLKKMVAEIWDMPSQYNLMSAEEKKEHDEFMDKNFYGLVSASVRERLNKKGCVRSSENRAKKQHISGQSERGGETR